MTITGSAVTVAGSIATTAATAAVRPPPSSSSATTSTSIAATAVEEGARARVTRRREAGAVETALGRLLVGGEGVEGGQLVRARAAGKGAAADRAQRLLGAVVLGQRGGVFLGDELEGVQAREGARGAAQQSAVQVGAVVAVVADGGAVVAEDAHQRAVLDGRGAAAARLRAPVVGRRRSGSGVGRRRADAGTCLGEV